MNDWIDLPIISAIEYFQGILGYFLNFAQKYGSFFGLIGLVWTGIRLVNSRIDLRSAWWDSLFKWFIFILLINFYAAGTSLISSISNEIGLNAGNGKSTIIKNFTSLKTRIEAEIKVYEKWVNGLTDLINTELGIELDYMDSNNNQEEYIIGLMENEQINNYKFSSKQQKKDFQKKLNAYFKSMPDTDNSIWGSQTLEALNAVLIMESADGDSKSDLTGAYVTDKPELNIWLKDSEGKATNYLSSSAVFRIGILTSQIIWEKSFMDVTEEVDSDGEIEYKVKKNNKFSVKKIGTYIMTGICCLCIIAAVAFALIQYVMCILEFTIVQGIGAAFIPFYLFDGTKDLPKKLLPVFTGFAIKILVMVICLMFVINMYLVFAAEQISPTSGSMGWPAFGECIFICLISFILTSNAPKIAMTLLTGQPQLSMGEFMQAAGAFAAGAVATKGVASTALSPAMAQAKQKAHEWSEQRGASTSARLKQENAMKQDFAQTQGIDTSTRAGRKNLDKKWNIYRNSDDRKGEFDTKLNTVGSAAREDVKLKQQAEYQKNGGALGSTGRLMAHYGGALLNPKQVLGGGIHYNSPMSNIDVDRVGDNNQLDDRTIVGRGRDPNFNLQDYLKNKPQNEPVKNDVAQDPNIGERQV